MPLTLPDPRRGRRWRTTPLPLKPIETNYKGYRFRSRLEARWAVFFETLDVRWEYEPQGYDLGDLGFYLPDFWLSTVKMFAEVKPEDYTASDHARCHALAAATDTSVLILNGTPAFRNYWACEPWDEGGEHNDYILTGHYLDEHRFFGCTGAAYPRQEEEEWIDADLNEAVAAARSARFEHGESS